MDVYICGDIKVVFIFVKNLNVSIYKKFGVIL